MSTVADPEALKKFEEVCGKAARAVKQAGTMREAFDASDVALPSTLRSVGRSSLMGLRRVSRALDNRLEELLQWQLEEASRIREAFMLERELDRLKVREWYTLRTDYPHLYAKALTQAAALQRRIQK